MEDIKDKVYYLRERMMSMLVAINEIADFLDIDDAKKIKIVEINPEEIPFAEDSPKKKKRVVKKKNLSDLTQKTREGFLEANQEISKQQ